MISSVLFRWRENGMSDEAAEDSAPQAGEPGTVAVTVGGPRRRSAATYTPRPAASHAEAARQRPVA